jgi:hypothetical protein
MRKVFFALISVVLLLGIVACDKTKSTGGNREKQVRKCI